jgi:hypothetical protein
MLLLHNPNLAASELLEIGGFLIQKFGLDQTSIWEFEDEYLDDLCGA